MIVVGLAWFSLCIGVPIIIAWASVDAFTGAQTLTADKGAAVIGVSFVTLCVAFAAMVVCDGTAGDRHRRERGWTSKPPPPAPRPTWSESRPVTGCGAPPNPPNKGSGAQNPRTPNKADLECDVLRILMQIADGGDARLNSAGAQYLLDVLRRQ
ncbi:hypothetical protein [Reyranella sp.]|jgi:hypothetical protein|uniref:hypothetical protein n=1 Tax=Reyranella sp. TaxID=1929291 RepID=UPI000BD511C6|nr:hypothetical protein [Reyranella sp.]OYZ91439.1 MAG: hypothetical protein B7Y08_25530 [Rhodospirillales bacterium 24-66-33]HQS15011.1 hypothetical protein [Reyranella sp.]HQT10820.1 hypothetical protein [Reyranella sp.]